MSCTWNFGNILPPAINMNEDLTVTTVTGLSSRDCPASSSATWNESDDSPAEIVGGEDDLVELSAIRVPPPPSRRALAGKT